jgi:hypothetical protein
MFVFSLVLIVALVFLLKAVLGENISALWKLCNLNPTPQHTLTHPYP